MNAQNSLPFEIPGGALLFISVIWGVIGIDYSQLPVFFVLLIAGLILAGIGTKIRRAGQERSDADVVKLIREDFQNSSDQ